MSCFFFYRNVTFTDRETGSLMLVSMLPLMHAPLRLMASMACSTRLSDTVLLLSGTSSNSMGARTCRITSLI